MKYRVWQVTGMWAAQHVEEHECQGGREEGCRLNKVVGQGSTEKPHEQRLEGSEETSHGAIWRKNA